MASVSFRATHNVLYTPFIHFMSAFPLGRVAGAAAPEGLGIPHGQQQFQIVLLAPHQDGTKQGRRCHHSTSGSLCSGFSQQYLLLYTKKELKIFWPAHLH